LKVRMGAFKEGSTQTRKIRSNSREEKTSVGRKGEGKTKGLESGRSRPRNRVVRGNQKVRISKEKISAVFNTQSIAGAEQESHGRRRREKKKA